MSKDQGITDQIDRIDYNDHDDNQFFTDQVTSIYVGTAPTGSKNSPGRPVRRIMRRAHLSTSHASTRFWYTRRAKAL
jgi:hypothetical protein